MQAVILLLLILIGSNACGQLPSDSIDQPYSSGFETGTLSIGEQNIEVEIARTASERQKGLSGRKSLAADRGMLFLYQKSRMLHFTMQQTLFPLDIAFINSQGVITEIVAMQAKRKESYSSSQPSQFALEVNSGWFENAGIRPGQTVDLTGIVEVKP